MLLFGLFVYVHACLYVCGVCGGEMGGIRGGEIGRIGIHATIFSRFFFVFLHSCEIQRTHGALQHMHTLAYKDEYVYVLVYAHVRTRDFDRGSTSSEGLEVSEVWV